MTDDTRNILPPSSGPALYTIGCSNGSIDDLVAELKRFGLTAVADIRSIPYSAHTPWFGRESLEKTLQSFGLMYVYLGAEFGAMRTKPERMQDETDSIPVTDGIVDFVKVRRTEAFLRGVARIKNGLAKGYRIALMCTELEPDRCHRSVMVTPAFADTMPIGHILRNGEVLTQGDVDRMLMGDDGKYQTSLFGESPLDQAYKDANHKIGIRISKKRNQRDERQF